VHAHESIREHGIVYTRMPDGDGVFSINVMVDGQRIHRVIGREGQGWHLVVRYAHVNTPHVQEAMDKLEARFKKVA
jgi:hypothetical protein